MQQVVPVCKPVPNLFLKRKGKSVNFCFYLASGEMQEENSGPSVTRNIQVTGILVDFYEW